MGPKRNAEWWEGIANRWGLSIVFLVILIWGIRDFAGWARPRADLLIDTHVAFVRSVQATNEQLVHANKELLNKHSETNLLLQSIERRISEQSK
jgi:hypothetical protein